MASVVLRFPDERLAALTSSLGSADVDTYIVVGTKGHLSVTPGYGFTMTAISSELGEGGRVVIAKWLGLRLSPLLPIADGRYRHIPYRRPQPFTRAIFQVSSDSRGRSGGAKVDICCLPRHGVKQPVLVP